MIRLTYTSGHQISIDTGEDEEGIAVLMEKALRTETTFVLTSGQDRRVFNMTLVACLEILP